MHPTHRAAPLVAFAASTLLLAASSPGWAAEPYDFSWSGSAMLTTAQTIAERAGVEVGDWIVKGYRRRPVVMIGLGGILLLPPLAVIGLLLYRRRPPFIAGSNLPSEAPPHAAWIEIDEVPGRVVIPAGRDILQIGRQEDNDICLDDETVHRYHAVIGRTLDLGFTITDVSGPDGNGIRVNGERRSISPLAHGDTVEVGRSRLKFAVAA